MSALGRSADGLKVPESDGGLRQDGAPHRRSCRVSCRVGTGGLHCSVSRSASSAHPASSTTAVTSSVSLVPPTPEVVRDPRPSSDELRTLAPSLRRCSPSDLVAQENQSNDWLTSGNGYALIIIANRSDTACQLSGTPRVLALDRRGHELSFRFVARDLEAVDPPAPNSPVALLPKQQARPDRGNAQFMLTWRSFRGHKCLVDPAAAAALRFFVEGHDDVSVVVRMQDPSDASQASARVAPCRGLVGVRMMEAAIEPAFP